MTMWGMDASWGPAAAPPSVLACEPAAALPQSHRRIDTDGGRAACAYLRSVFARVVVALDSRSDRRDALVLSAQLAGADGAVVVADLLPTGPTPLAGGTAAAARRRERLRDAGEEVYATLGPDPRVRYLPVSGLPLADAVISLAGRERADVIVIGQRLVGHGTETARLIARSPCPVAIAPYGHRFARAFAPGRVGVVAGDSGAEEWLAAAQRLAPEADTVLLGGRAEAARVAQSAEVDLVVIDRGDDEVLRQAACPVLVVGKAAAPLIVAAARR
jgi:nucleotide-binding universal stress UspA family protein